MTTDPTDLPAEKVAALTEALAADGWEGHDYPLTRAHLQEMAAALAPLVAGWLAEARRDGIAQGRDDLRAAEKAAFELGFEGGER